MELLPIIVQVIKGTFERIAQVLSNVWGWIASIIAFLLTGLVTWLGDTREMCVYLVLVAIGLDLIWGIWSSFKRGQFAVSIGITKTGIKLAVYFSILTVVALGEKAMADDWYITFRAASSILIVAEGISIMGHILIINPETPVVRFFWKILRSEIAKKLGVEVKDVDEFYNSINKKKDGTGR